ncbi:MAG: NAD(P)H-hydrate dehydratase, partial [Desulfobulbaceae bacterium]|nr:NAD(P)H-hydrate dehydratase [Desulfobulbaceae bacterium]
GLNADNGRPLGCCVQADLTATYGLAKPAHYMHGGKHIGRLKIVDIGIPAAVVDNAALPGESLDESTAKLLKLRKQEAHKGTFGHLLILAGGEGKTGAAILSARGALHSGTGLVTLAVPHGLNVIFEPSLIEAMTVPLPSSKNTLSIDDFDPIIKLSRDKRAVVLGPGIGMEKQTEQLVLRLFAELELPMVIDADALNILALHPDTLSSPAGPRIITPHPGEMSRLTGLSSRDVQKDRLTTALGFTRGKKQLITVLKGAGTVIAGADGKWAVNTTGNAGMATGGMGDVLAGLIGSLLAQNYAPWDAAGLGVYLHGLAADLLAETGEYGYLASDVAAILPRAITISRRA